MLVGMRKEEHWIVRVTSFENSEVTEKTTGKAEQVGLLHEGKEPRGTVGKATSKYHRK